MGGKTTLDPEVKNYPQWKTILWRFLRGAVSGGIASMTTIAIVLQPDLTNIKVYLFALTAAFITGVMQALGKLARTEFDDTSAIQKIPF